jgi:DNA-binding NtrC family response regulator
MVFWFRSRVEDARVEVLAVSEDDATLDAIERAFAPTQQARVIRLTDAHAALAVLGSRPLAGAVIDGALPNRLALVLSRAFLQHQPVGHVAIISAADDPTTLVGLAFRDSRVELLFRPVDADAVRTLVLGEQLVGAG